MKSSRTALVAFIVAASPWFVAPLAAAPATSALMLRSAAASSVETVQYRRGWRGHYHGGAGIGIGAGIAGALIGGAIIGATQPYGYYGYPPGYYGPAYVAPPPMSMATRSAIARNVSGPTTCIPAPISATTAYDIPAREDDSLSFGSLIGCGSIRLPAGIRSRH
ncbi:hypothetical protein ACQ86E_30960 [Bradyrhizobium betae]|uniref:hypothetical protein n=1 Tax=Bradyrhizobium betae TaxID=244734 RepID=UPI003D66FEE6